jgi:prepilin-type N-terminal cleavage/methylation domain-containing protein
MTRRRPNGPHGDEGFTLVEVIVALALLTVTATAALYFFVGGTRAVSHQQQSQNAVVVANEAMERAYSVGAKRAGDVSGLLAGRHQDDVEAAWASVATAGLEGYAATYPAWDPAADPVGPGDEPSENDAVPLIAISELNSLEYEALTLIGPCYRSKVLPDSACGRTSSPTAPDSAPSGYTELMRVMVRVTWQSQSCPENGCSYQVSSLIDPNSDLTWNNTTKPIAVDDDAGVEVGQPEPIDVLGNDIIGVVVNNPVQLVGAPTAGTATVQTDGTILYVAPPKASGIKTFTYKLKDQSGRESNVATVRVRVTPVTVDDVASTVKNQPITVDVAANDNGTPGSVAIVTPPTGKGTATASGKTITYNPGNFTGTATVTYRFTDADGLVAERPGTLTITVSAWAPPKVTDATVKIPATVGKTMTDLNIRGLTANPSGYLYEVVSVTMNQGRTFVDGRDYNAGTNTTGSTLAYEQQGNVLGVWTIQYRVLTPDKSVASEVKTITVKLIPVGQPDTATVRKSGSVEINIGTNDAPMNYNGTVQLTPTFSNPTCGTIPKQQGNLLNGRVTFQAGSKAGTCTFTYTLRGTGTYADIVSDPVTVTVQVNN